jgi:hypothetical protein
MKSEQNAMVISIFEMANHLGYFVPEIHLRYDERDTGLRWFITCGGTRAYVARVGETSRFAPDQQAADSHFMWYSVSISDVKCGPVRSPIKRQSSSAGRR